MKIHASLSSADPLALGDAIDALVAAGVDGLHVDLCDGVFAPGIQGSLDVVRAVAERGGIPVWVHLMVGDPEPVLRDLAGTGAIGVAVHVEAARYPRRLRALADRLRLHFALAVNPATPLDRIEAVADVPDVVSLLTTEPDAAGEEFLPGMLARAERARWMLRGRTLLEVDGGVRIEVARQLAGVADRIVVGRALTAASDPSAVVAAMRALPARMPA